MLKNLSILRKIQLATHSHFWNSGRIKGKCLFVTGTARTGGRFENRTTFLKLKLRDLQVFRQQAPSVQSHTKAINCGVFKTLLVVSGLSYTDALRPLQLHSEVFSLIALIRV